MVGKGCRIRRRRGLVSVLLFLSIVSAYASENATIEIEPTRVPIGERFTVRIRTNIPWKEEVLITRPELIGPMRWWAYPYARPWSIENDDGELVRMVEVLGAVRVDGVGFHRLGPFRIGVGDREAITETREIIGLKADEASFLYPVLAGWREIPQKAWQGQAVPIVLEARNLTSLSLADSVVLSTAPDGLLEDAPSLGNIQTRPHGHDILYDVPIASWIWTIDAPGRHRFPDVRVSVAGLNRTSPSFQLEVLPLPEPVQTSTAVGYYSLTTEWDEGPYRVGDAVSVRIRVEGEGNLNVLKLPVPHLEGSSVMSQASTSSYVPSSGGFHGWREDRYDFQLERAGNLQLSIPAWNWLEPGAGGRIRVRREESVVLAAQESLNVVRKSHADFLLGSDIFRYPTAAFHWHNPYWLLLALPGLITLLILFCLYRPRKRMMLASLIFPLLLSFSEASTRELESVDQAVKLAGKGDWNGARIQYQDLLTDIGEFPGLLHDLAITEMEAGRADTAVALIRRALYLRPGSRRISATREYIEERFGLTDYVPVPLRLPVSLVFALWLVAINLFFLSLALLLFHRDSREVIICVSALFILVASSFFVGYSERAWRHATAVVRADSRPLRKIPGPLATNWIQLPAGSALSITARKGEDYLVRTGYGLEGWLPQSSLILVMEPVNGF